MRYTIVALLGCLLMTGLAACAHAEPVSVAAPAPAITTAAAGTPLPTPTDAPAGTPIPASSFEESYFRRTGDAPEVVVVDDEHGYWAYRSDALDVRIDCVTADLGRGNATYFVANVRVRALSQVRGLIAEGGAYPWRLARESGAVLLLAGDNLDRTASGARIRGGKVYTVSGEQTAAAFYPDLSMRLVPGGTDAQTLIAEGVLDAFACGPALVIDGEPAEGLRRASGRGVDARTGVGMLENGHYLIVVADGRQSGYSVGLTLHELAGILVEHGAVTAYNLAGGRAAALVFMGEHLNHHAGTYAGADPSYQARVFDALAFGESALVPGVTDEVKNDGNR